MLGANAGVVVGDGVAVDRGEVLFRFADAIRGNLIAAEREFAKHADTIIDDLGEAAVEEDALLLAIAIAKAERADAEFAHERGATGQDADLAVVGRDDDRMHFFGEHAAFRSDDVNLNRVLRCHKASMYSLELDRRQRDGA